MSADGSLPRCFGRYEVLEELGSGAMGVVYLCVDPRLTRPVAVKVLRESDLMSDADREQYRARFRHEAEAAGRLNHPDVVQIYDIGPSYLVMEFVEGTTLAGLMRTGAVLRAEQVASTVLRVADALDHAHRHGIVHRDVKPSNIMLTGHGGVKVMDFGVARLESSTLTVAGTVVGSVRYMAPEQMMGETVDGRADTFSLAAVAYELLTAAPPFPGKTITEVVSRVVRGGHVPPRQADRRLPEALDAVFARAFAPRPADRHARAVEFAEQMQGALRACLDLEIAHRHQDDATVPTRAIGQHSTTKGGTQEGVLMLDSDPPAARVTLDGRPLGVTPLSGLAVSFGRHVVRLEAAGRDPVSAEIEVDRSQAVKAVTFTLPMPARADGEVKPGELVSLGPDVVPPRRISGTVPRYPEAARERGLEGSPTVEVWVSETGDVIDVAIVASAGAILDGALLQAVAGWRFSPPLFRTVPVSMRITVQHLFRR